MTRCAQRSASAWPSRLRPTCRILLDLGLQIYDPNHAEPIGEEMARRLATETQPPAFSEAVLMRGKTHWSCLSMAEKVGVSKDTVQGVVCAGSKPNLVKTFKVSNDPLFGEVDRRGRVRRGVFLLRSRPRRQVRGIAERAQRQRHKLMADAMRCLRRNASSRDTFSTGLPSAMLR